MKINPLICSCTALFLLAVLSLPAEDKKEIPPKPPGKHPPMMMAPDHDFGPMEKVTFLGVETAPVGRTLAAQLGLPVDVGLVVARVLADSPAASVLQEHDILMKFADQLVIDPHQLSVLVRARKEAEEVPLTLYRGGKEITLKAKLGQREMPKHPRPDGFPPGAEQDHHMGFSNEEFPGSGDMRWRQLPGMEPEDVQDAMRTIGRERHNWFGAPPVHFFGRKDHDGSTILNLAEGNFVFSDDAGSIAVQASGGQRELTVKNAKGEITYHGPINNAADREKVPPEVMARLHRIEKSEFNDEPGEEFEHHMAVEPPGRIKIGQPLDPHQERERIPASPAF